MEHACTPQFVRNINCHHDMTFLFFHETFLHVLLLLSDKLFHIFTYIPN